MCVSACAELGELSLSACVARGRTQEALKGGHFVDVLSILLRLQRICNHPGLVEPRVPQSSFSAWPLQLRLASLVLKALDRDTWKVRRGSRKVGLSESRFRDTFHTVLGVLTLGSTKQPLCYVFLLTLHLCLVLTCGAGFLSMVCAAGLCT